jgi:hypothetical protein
MHRRWRKKREMKKKSRTGTQAHELQHVQDEDEDILA